MRLWSIHPGQLDRIGLVAGWREALLAQQVLSGNTRGYRHHPQLTRFRASADPLGSVAAFLAELAGEADRRGYRFDRALIRYEPDGLASIPVTDGQLRYEWTLLLAKLDGRDPALATRLRLQEPRPHPLFGVVPGPVEPWEVLP
jgi:hypothetical protein